MWQQWKARMSSSLTRRQQLLLILLIPLTLALLLPTLFSPAHSHPSTPHPSPLTSLLHRLFPSLTPHPSPTPSPIPSTWRLVNNTAEGVALLRYLASLDPSSPISPSERDSLALLLPPHLVTLAGHPSTRAALRRGALPGVYEAVVGRTEAIDDVVKRVVKGGGGGGREGPGGGKGEGKEAGRGKAEGVVEQVVVLGAGSDTRGLRFHPQLAKEGVRWFEVDLADEQARKQAKLQQALKAEQGSHTAGDLAAAVHNIRFVPTNLTQAAARQQVKGGLQQPSNLPSMWQALHEAGYSDDKPTLFILEGLTAYLPPAVVNDTLTSLHRHSPPSSVLVLDFFSGDAACREEKEWRLMVEALEGMGEPVQFVLEVEEEKVGEGEKGVGGRKKREVVAGWLSRQGWHLVELEGPKELQARLPGGEEERVGKVGRKEEGDGGKGEGGKEKVACYEQVATARNKPIEIDIEIIEA